MIRLGDGWLYARKSTYRGRLKYRGRSVEEQVTESRGWCSDNDVRVAGEFIDDDRSASPMAEVPREAFEHMVTAIERGVIKRGDVVVVWEASRFYRDLEVYVLLRKVCAKAGVYWCVNGELFDLTKRSDRRRSAHDAVDAEDRALEISEQVQRALRSNARQGKPHGRHQFGYTRVYDDRTGDLVEVIKNEQQAEVVEELFKRVYGRESQYAVMADFNARGIWSPSGKVRHSDIGSGLAKLRQDAGLSSHEVATAMRWKARRVERIEDAKWGVRLDELQALCDLFKAPDALAARLEARWRELPQWTNSAQVGKILRNRAYIGRRHHNGGRDESEAIWPPIVSEEIFNAVNVMLKDPRRRWVNSTEASHLLSHLADCGKARCGGVSQSQWRPPRDPVFIACRKDRSPSGVRDFALLLLLEASAGRYDEVAAARVEDCDLDSGVVRVAGDGGYRDIRVNDYTTRRIRWWLEVRGDEPGPLFCPVDDDRVEVGPLTAMDVRVIANTRRVQARLQPLAAEEFPLVFTAEDAGFLTYQCSVHRCFSVRAEVVERYVVAQLVTRFARHDAPALFAVCDDGDDKSPVLRARIDKWQADLAEAEHLVAAGEMSVTRLANLEELISPEIKAAERQLHRAVRNPLVERLISPDAEAVYAEWLRLTLWQQRSVISSELRIVVSPVGSGRRDVPVEEYVHLSWRREQAA